MAGITFKEFVEANDGLCGWCVHHVGGINSVVEGNQVHDEDRGIVRIPLQGETGTIWAEFRTNDNVSYDNGAFMVRWPEPEPGSKEKPLLTIRLVPPPRTREEAGFPPMAA